MVFQKKLAIAAMGALLLTTASAWAGPADTQTPAAASLSGESSMLNFLKPLMSDADIRARQQKTCSPDTLYSSHDVVGDADSCFVNKLDSRNGATNPTFPGIF
jgi:ABC-type proline/glycine betaine transport system substrate-binding protein